MTQDELRAWLELRCTPGEIDFWMTELQGKSEDELDELYDALHGSMA